MGKSSEFSSLKSKTRSLIIKANIEVRTIPQFIKKPPKNTSLSTHYPLAAEHLSDLVELRDKLLECKNDGKSKDFLKKQKAEVDKTNKVIQDLTDVLQKLYAKYPDEIKDDHKVFLTECNVNRDEPVGDNEAEAMESGDDIEENAEECQPSTSGATSNAIKSDEYSEADDSEDEVDNLLPDKKPHFLRVLKDFGKNDPDALKVKKGDIVKYLSDVGDGLLKVQSSDGKKTGLVAKNIVEHLQDQDTTNTSKQDIVDEVYSEYETDEDFEDDDASEEESEGEVRPSKTNTVSSSTESPKKLIKSIGDVVDAKPTPVVSSQRWRVLQDYSGDANSLKIKKDDVLEILEFAGNWWKARSSDGTVGLVPKNFLRKLDGAGSAEDSDDDETEYETDEDEEAENEGEEDLKEVVQDKPLKEYQNDEASSADEGQESPKKKPSGGWSMIKQATGNKPSTADVLQAMGACPSGFRETTLGALASHADQKYSFKKYLMPALSDSGLEFRDVYWNSTQKRLQALESRFSKTISIINIRNVPPPGTGLQVLSRHIRVCLFDGEKVRSNILTIKATCRENDPRTWNFTGAKIRGLMPSLLDGNILIRAEDVSHDIGLLIELNFLYVRPSSKQTGEMSCGYTFLRLYEDFGNNAHLVNKTYSCVLNGGTPYERGVDLDATLGEASGKLRAMISTNKQAILQLKVSDLSGNDARMALDLPRNILSPVSYISLISFYRLSLGEKILKKRNEPNSAELASCPFLATFPQICDVPDLADALRSEWTRRFPTFRKVDKKDVFALIELFRTCFLQTVYPLFYSRTLPEFSLADQSVQVSRWNKISEYLKRVENKDVLQLLLSSDIQHIPFSIQETTLDMFNHMAPVVKA